MIEVNRVPVVRLRGCFGSISVSIAAYVIERGSKSDAIILCSLSCQITIYTDVGVSVHFDDQARLYDQLPVSTDGERADRVRWSSRIFFPGYSLVLRNFEALKPEPMINVIAARAAGKIRNSGLPAPQAHRPGGVGDGCIYYLRGSGIIYPYPIPTNV